MIPTYFGSLETGSTVHVYSATSPGSDPKTLVRLIDINMAPKLAASQNNLIRDMTYPRILTTAQMATVAGCSERSIKAIKSNLRNFNFTEAPANGNRRS